MNAVQRCPNGYDHDFVADERGAARGLDRRPAVRRVRGHAADPRDPEALQVRGSRPACTVTSSRDRLVSWPREFYTARGAGPEFSQAKVIDALNTQTAYTDNGFIQPIDWTKGHNDPTKRPVGAQPAGVRQLRDRPERQVRARSEHSPASRGCASTATDPTVDNPTHVSFAPVGHGLEPRPRATHRSICSCATADQQHPVGHELRQRVRAARGRARARVQDVGRLQPRVRRAGVRRRARSTTTLRVRARLADPARVRPRGARSSRRCSGSSSTARCSGTCARAPPVARLVTVLGLLVAIPQILKLWFGQNPQYGTQRDRARAATRVQPVRRPSFVSRDDIATIGDHGRSRSCCSTLLFRYTALGSADARGRREPADDRARRHRRRPREHGVVDALQHPRRARGRAARPAVRRRSRDQLHDARRRRDRRPPCSASLTSIPLAFVGGLGLGVVGEVVDAYLPTNSVLASNLRPVAAVRRAVPGADPLARAAQPARARPTRSPASIRRHRRPPRRCAAAILTNGTRVLGVVVVLGGRLLPLLPRRHELGRRSRSRPRSSR